MVQDVQAYEKPTQDRNNCDDKNHRHSMLSPGCCVVIIIITAQTTTSFRGILQLLQNIEAAEIKHTRKNEQPYPYGGTCHQQKELTLSAEDLFGN